MRRSIIAWIVFILEILAVSLLLPSLLSRSFDYHYMALGESLAILGAILAVRRFWPKPGQVDRASLVFMAVSALPFRLVATGARWHIRWRLVANAAWGTLLLLSLTSVVAAIFGDRETVLILVAVVAGLNLSRMLFVMMTRVPADSGQQ